MDVIRTQVLLGRPTQTLTKSTDSRGIQPKKTSLFVNDSHELFVKSSPIGGVGRYCLFSPSRIFLYPLLEISPIFLIAVRRVPLTVYLTSRMEGLDSMMATMILSI